MQSKDRIDELTQPKDQSQLSREQSQRLFDTWTWLLSTRNGRVIFRDLLQLSHFGISAYAVETNPTMKNAGKQEVGEYLMERLNTCYPEAYALMLKEAREDAEHDRQSREQQQSSTGNTGYVTG